MQGRYDPIDWDYHKHTNFQECQQAAPVRIMVVAAASTAAGPTGTSEAGLEGLLIMGISAAAGAKIAVIVPP